MTKGHCSKNIMTYGLHIPLITHISQQWTWKSWSLLSSAILMVRCGRAHLRSLSGCFGSDACEFAALVADGDGAALEGGRCAGWAPKQAIMSHEYSTPLLAVQHCRP
jgi:hypothetical protein